jgi:hypothetical protein
MNAQYPLLAPVIGLAVWYAVIWVWMYVTRIPAISKSKMVLDGHAPRGEQMATLPAEVRWKADNHNHLLEQPQVFYAVAIALALLGDTSATSLYLAWGYVGLRVVHSLVQVLINHILTRFAFFALSSLLLFALTFKAATLVF